MPRNLFGRFAIDDGRHLLRFDVDVVESALAGETRHRAECSCGRMPAVAVTRDQALAAHLEHVSTRLGPPAGPPVGRVALLATAMLIIWGACCVTGQIVVHDQGLTGTAATAATAVSALTGLGLAAGLMVAVRRHIAPTRE